MASVYKRESDKELGPQGKWTISYTGPDGRRKRQAGFVSKAESLRLAQELEAEARRVREGLDDLGARERRAQAARPVTQHVEDYRLGLLAKGDTRGHARHTAGVLKRILEDAAVGSVAEIAPDRIQQALGRLKQRRSARTCNHALRALRAFAKWLVENNRIREVPRGLASIPLYPEESDRRRMRRALTVEELARLLVAAETGPTLATRREGRGGRPVAHLTGPERAVVYRIVMATGFRANEVRTLTPERFRLGLDRPSIVVAAAYSKRGKRSGRDDVQPIRRDVAELLKPWLEGKEPGKPAFAVPVRTAEMLRVDLAAAGIPYVNAKGEVLDFHALRHSFVTHLASAGTMPKVLQLLARHSDIKLTLGRYTHAGDDDLRGALEDGPGAAGPRDADDGTGKSGDVAGESPGSAVK